jgi:hypothetical protein
MDVGANKFLYTQVQKEKKENLKIFAFYINKLIKIIILHNYVTMHEKKRKKMVSSQKWN